MDTADALLRVCLENPDDDTPRLAYADWLDENGQPGRAEFVRVQVAIARHWYTGDIPAGLQEREKELLAAHQAEWNPLPRAMWEYTYFARGLLTSVDVATDEEAAALARCRELQRVKVGGPDVTDAALVHVSRLPYVDEVHLIGCAVTAAGMRALARLPRLRVMDASGVTVGRWFDHFRDCPRLVRVRGYSHATDGITPEEWAAWEQARAERFRQASPEEKRRIAVGFLVEEWDYYWKAQRRLRLIQQRIWDTDLELIAAIPDVSALDLYETAITSRGLRHLRGATELRALGLGANDIDNLDGLAGMTQFRELNLIGMYAYGDIVQPLVRTLTDTGTYALATLTGLESLCLSFNAITDATLAHLAGLTGLRKLELQEVPGVTDLGLVYLRGLINLEHLDLRGTSVTSAGVRALREHLPRVEVMGGEG